MQKNLQQRERKHTLHENQGCRPGHRAFHVLPAQRMQGWQRALHQKRHRILCERAPSFGKAGRDGKGGKCLNQPARLGELRPDQKPRYARSDIGNGNLFANFYQSADAYPAFKQRMKGFARIRRKCPKGAGKAINPTTMFCGVQLRNGSIREGVCRVCLRNIGVKNMLSRRSPYFCPAHPGTPPGFRGAKAALQGCR